jgi:hypothetical protein
LSNPSACHQAEQQRQNDRSNDSHKYRIDETTLACETDGTHQEAADNSADHPDYDIHDWPVASTAHDFASQPTGDEPDYNPPQYEHTPSFSLSIREALVPSSLRPAKVRRLGKIQIRRRGGLVALTTGSAPKSRSTVLLYD